MECDKRPADKDDEILYWKNLAKQYQDEKIDLQRTLDDYTEESQQLEKELEAALEQAEKANRDLRSERNKLQFELDSYKTKLEQTSKEINALQKELAVARSDFQRQTVYIRELEQKNDDLERNQRIVAESAAAAESTLNVAIERNAMLESEMCEKEQLKIKLQRLMDETRDLKQELLIKERHIQPDNERIITNGFSSEPIDSNRLECEDKFRPQSPTKKDPGITGSGMTPSARHSALNLVSDIIRKMSTLEAKVAACRNKDHAQGYAVRDPRTRRIACPTTNSHQTVQH